MTNRSKGKHRRPAPPIRRHVLTASAIVALLAGTGATGAALQALTPEQSAQLAALNVISQGRML